MGGVTVPPVVLEVVPPGVCVLPPGRMGVVDAKPVEILLIVGKGVAVMPVA